MPDTPEEKQTARMDCYKCKYAEICELFAEWKRIGNLHCIIGVK